MIDEIEPRTTLDMLKDSLDYLEEYEWMGQYEDCPRGCCREWVTKCNACSVDMGEEKSEDYRKHKDTCQLDKLIKEIRAYIEVEEKLKIENV